jgi:uncharacterized membrane protein
MKQPKPNNHQREITISQQQFYSGPVPDPDSLAKYENISPGFADRLLKMGEKEQQERINTQNKIIDTEKELNVRELNNYKRGQIFALLAVMLVVGLCVYAFFLGYSKEARDIAITVIAGIASVFIAGRLFLWKKISDKDKRE